MAETVSVPDLLIEACKRLDLAGLQQYGDDVWGIAVDAELTVEAEWDAGRAALALIGNLGKPLIGEEAATHKLLLMANGLWRDPEGLRFSLDGATDARHGDVHLTSEFPLGGVDGDALCARLTAFFKAVRDWRGVVASRAGDLSPPTLGSEPLLRV